MLLAFDWFNTLGDILNFATPEERAEYGRQILWNQENVYREFNLAERWERMPVFEDVARGLERLSRDHTVAIFSNAPAPLMGRMLLSNGISQYVDCIIPLEQDKCSKPLPRAYEYLREYAFDMYRLPPSRVMVVTANETFGDIAGAKAQGMRATLIRGTSNLKTLHDLADWLDQRRTSMER